jgi:CheY-like chemotaxis protein
MAKTILVVDDNEIDAILAEQALKNAGYTVELAPNGKIAMEMLHKRQHDCSPYGGVVTDLNMPIMNGLQLIQELRLFAAFKDLPVFMCTTEEEGLGKKAGLAGATKTFTKPVDLSELVKTVKEHIGD